MTVHAQVTPLPPGGVFYPNSIEHHVRGTWSLYLFRWAMESQITIIGLLNEWPGEVMAQNGVFNSANHSDCLTHHGPVPHICVAIFRAYFPSAPDMGRWFHCSFPQCPIHGAWQTARSSPVPQIVVARPHLLSHQRPIYVARHGPLSLHVLCGKY